MGSSVTSHSSQWLVSLVQEEKIKMSKDAANIFKVEIFIKYCFHDLIFIVKKNDSEFKIANNLKCQQSYIK